MENSMAAQDILIAEPQGNIIRDELKPKLLQ